MSVKRLLWSSPSSPERDREDLAFLPAALEIVETPSSPTGRVVMYAIGGLFLLALLWASIGRVDIVASAIGRIVPRDGAKLIQPFETSVVRSIHVRDGQRVKAGDVLIELDPTINNADLGHIRADLTTAELDAARIQAALSNDINPLAAFRAPEGADPAARGVQTALLVHQVEEQHAKLAALDGQIAQKQAELATVKANVNKLETVLPILKERVDIRELLYNRQTGSKVNYLEILQAYTEGQLELSVQKSRLNEADSAITAAKQARLQTEAEFQRNLYTQLVDAQRKADGLREDLRKASQRSRLQLLEAPVDGMVQQLAVHTVGGVVTAAQVLLVVVPAASPLEIEAMLSNRDVGFVHAGQDTEVKIDTFNFTRYGLLHGKVISISRDAVVRERASAGSADKARGTQDSTSEPVGQELNYSVRVSLDRSQMDVDGNAVNLTPGMAVTAEIKTGSRTIISYLLSPILRYGHESLHER